MVRIGICLIAFSVVAGGLVWFFGFDRVLFDRPSAFNGSVRVTEDFRGRRFLRFGSDRATQSASMKGDAMRGVLPYVREAVGYSGMVERVGRVLVIGMGGGSIGMLMRQRYPLAWIELVDIDPVVVEAAELLGFRADERMRVVVEDGAAMIARVEARYDVIFLDAYNGLDVPAQLLTREFFAALAKALTPGGVVISNVLSRDINAGFEVVRQGLGEVFAVGSVSVPGGRHNCIVMAAHSVEVFRGLKMERSGVCQV